MIPFTLFIIIILSSYSFTALHTADCLIAEYMKNKSN